MNGYLETFYIELCKAEQTCDLSELCPSYFLSKNQPTHIFSLFVHLAMLYAELGTVQLGDKKESHKEPIFLTDNQKKTKG